MEIRKIVLDPHDSAAVEQAFAEVAAQPIACCNWPESYPYAPMVKFRMFHTGSTLLLRFDVAERYTAARVTHDNGEVWTDSCVEFFIALDRNGYYNFETTCIGRMLLGYHKSREEAQLATPEVLATVQRTASLGTTPFTEREGDNRWSMTLAIPATALFHHTLKEWSNVDARVNLYKCGDALSHPHFLSWQPIHTDKPDFHRPEFFEHIKFSI
ncbi:MAG: carbohydrate-binding family 9-like protein [Alistipes sp.]